MKPPCFAALKSIRNTAAALALATLSGACALTAFGAIDWATGAGLQKRLAEPVGPAGVAFSGSPLREALHDLAHAKRVAVLMDRRVDPGQKLELQLHDVSLGRALELIARHGRLGLSQFGPVAYFGPPSVTSRLRTIAALRSDEVRRLPPAVAGRFLSLKRIGWDDFSTPRQLLLQLAEENRLTIVGLDRVPHDLWAAADLPSLSLVDRLTLVLVQFDLTFRISPDGKTVTLASFSEDVALVRSYPGGRDPKSIVERFAALAPEAQIKVVGGKVYVKGLLETHERLVAGGKKGTDPIGVKHAAGRPGKLDLSPLSPFPAPQPTQGVGKTGIERIRIDKMSVTEMPVGELLKELAARLELRLVIDHRALQEAGISLDRPVSVTVEQVTVDELFRELAQPARLNFRRRGNVVEIGPAE